MHLPEEFVGSDRSHEDFEALAATMIDQKLLKEESALFSTKWWDYRFMHPTKATYLFAHFYKQAIKRALRKRCDVYKAANYKGLKSEELFENAKTTITGMWKARQMADKHGVPYWFWCWKAMEYGEQRDWQWLPKPTQLYSLKPHAKARPGSPSIVEFILSAWVDRLLERLELSDSEVYKVKNYFRHSYQRQYQKWVFERLIMKRLRPETVAHVVYEKEHLWPNWFTSQLDNGEELLRKGKKFLQLA